MDKPTDDLTDRFVKALDRLEVPRRESPAFSHTPRRSWFPAIAAAAAVVVLALVLVPALAGRNSSVAGPDSGIATSPSPSPSPSRDCGSARLSNASSTYDQAMLDCVWAAYTRGETARVSITMVTTEGAPVPTTLLAVPGGRSVVTRDLTADPWTIPAERVVSTYSCTTLTRRPSASDPARYFFDLFGCTGPRATSSFP